MSNQTQTLRIIVCEEKHGTAYHDASTDERWAQASIDILKERMGYYYCSPEEEFAPRNPANLMTKEEIDALPEHLQDQERVKLKRYNGQLRAQQQYEKWYTEVKEVIETNDLSMVTFKSSRTGKVFRVEPRAWVLLHDRRDHEYENVELETPQVHEPKVVA